MQERTAGVNFPSARPDYTFFPHGRVLNFNHPTAYNVESRTVVYANPKGISDSKTNDIPRIVLRLTLTTPNLMTLRRWTIFAIFALIATN
jgi:hypothetical protein